MQAFRKINGDEMSDTMKESAADMVAGCVNGIPVIKMPRALADALGFSVTPVKGDEGSESPPDE